MMATMEQNSEKEPVEAEEKTPETEAQETLQEPSESSMEDSETEPLEAKDETQDTEAEDNPLDSSMRASGELLRWLPWVILNLVVVGSSIAVGSVVFIGTAVTLAIFSPILIPAGILLCLTVGGGLATVAVALAVFAVCRRLYMRLKASHENIISLTSDATFFSGEKWVLPATGPENSS
ncbi:hypothetical protein AXG93_2278s1700 [Marchantia polymorpha subsp. ruderalis]|uniref:Oleosin n=1 Tax=Marchantia polymorpha subsp. ruderalis TaxID=1480154 RepID=A0A176WG87_MARPO|nr:hypothetical protein AXG93_2278s1700 [Marchantia polymorpha subsp. ruderalis]